MIQTLSLYFSTFLRPTKEDEDLKKLDSLEVMGISWALHIVYAFYSIFVLYLGIISYEYLAEPAGFSEAIFASVNISIQKISLMLILFEVVLYPFFFQFGFKFWAFILKFYGELFDYKESTPIEDAITSILNSIFTANIFLLIPVFGNVLSMMTEAYYLFIGLKAKLHFTNTQAFLVLITPLFFLFLSVILVASYFTLLLSLL